MMFTKIKTNITAFFFLVCDRKFYDLQLYTNHLREEKSHDVKLKANYEEIARVQELMVRDVCDYGVFRCLYCTDCAYNKIGKI